MNEKLEEAPELVNNDPYGDGWMITIKLANPDDVKGLMSADDYKAFIEGLAK
jgi:glycine cleavage system H protein